MGVDTAAQLVYGQEIDTSEIDNLYGLMYETIYDTFRERYPNISVPFEAVGVGDQYGGKEVWVLAHKDDVYRDDYGGAVIRPTFESEKSYRLREYAASVGLKLKGEPGLFFALGMS